MPQPKLSQSQPQILAERWYAQWQWDQVQLSIALLGYDGQPEEHFRALPLHPCVSLHSLIEATCSSSWCCLAVDSKHLPVTYRGSNAPWAPRLRFPWHEGWAQMQGETWPCYSPAPGKTGSRKDAHPWQQLLPQVLWTILQVHQQPGFGVGIAANIATGFCCFQAALSAAVPSASMADRMVNEALKAFQLRLNFSALQFKTKLSRSVSDNLVWFLRR